MASLSSFPIILPVGFVAVYGPGFSTPTPQGVINPPGTLWGSVYNVWDGGATYVYNGDSVSFREEDVRCRLAIGSARYTIVPARLATKEYPVL